MKNQSYGEALAMLAKRFVVFSTANRDTQTTNAALQSASRDLSVVETMYAAAPEHSWYVRAYDAGDNLTIIHAKNERELSRLSAASGVDIPKTWTLWQTRTAGVYALFSSTYRDPLFVPYRSLCEIKAEVTPFAPLPDGARYRWYPLRAPDQIPLARLPDQLIAKLPQRQAQVKSITARTVARDEFDPRRAGAGRFYYENQEENNR